jgi:uncharacterized protein YoxC
MAAIRVMTDYIASDESYSSTHAGYALETMAEALNRLDVVEAELKRVDKAIRHVEDFRLAGIEQEVQVVKDWQAKQSDSLNRLADMISASNDLTVSTNQAVAGNSQALAGFISENRSNTTKLIASIVAGLLALSITGIGFVWGIWVLTGEPTP